MILLAAGVNLDVRIGVCLLLILIGALLRRYSHIFVLKENLPLKANIPSSNAGGTISAEAVDWKNAYQFSLRGTILNILGIIILMCGLHYTWGTFTGDKSSLVNQFFGKELSGTNLGGGSHLDVPPAEAAECRWHQEDLRKVTVPVLPGADWVIRHQGTIRTTGNGIWLIPTKEQYYNVVRDGNMYIYTGAFALEEVTLYQVPTDPKMPTTKEVKLTPR